MAVTAGRGYKNGLMGEVMPFSLMKKPILVQQVEGGWHSSWGYSFVCVSDLRCPGDGNMDLPEQLGVGPNIGWVVGPKFETKLCHQFSG